ncbi:MAG: response regulator [Ignavibacteriales bacterium]|nr:response regulator [Ignavibacteriales bacterium]
MSKKKILWVDDEIELLRSHIIFLSEKGYEIITVTNGEDAIEAVKQGNFDLIFLDEMMPGMGGLETLNYMKEIDNNVPVVMVTKNEEESLMHDAIGSKISDYLIKPVVPSQILMVCKKFLEKSKISGEYATKDYLQDFNSINRQLFEAPDYEEWIDIYLKLVKWDIELGKDAQSDLYKTLVELKRECNSEFCKYIENNYKTWVNNLESTNRPTLTVEVLDKYVVEHLKANEGPVFFLVIDCLRMDQWFVLEKYLYDMFTFTKDYYYGIIPSATPYARNSLFSGLFPSEIENYYPDLWKNDTDDENSMNKHEKELLRIFCERKRIKLRNDVKYIKIIDPELGKNLEQNLHTHVNTHLMAIVINFIDMIVHHRSDSAVLKEIAPDEAAFRSLTESWFQHSNLMNIFKIISKMKNATIIVTTDHGSIRTLRASKIMGNRDTSTNLRFKFGKNFTAEEKDTVYIRNPQDFRLPKRGMTTSYIFAKEDNFFIYPTDYNLYLNKYKDTFQHGGISMEEMLLPVITMKTKV